jgi:penicillin-binding protein 1C
MLICLWMASRQADVTIPSYVAVRAAYQASDISILDRHGEVLHERRVDPRGRRLAWTPLADISPALQAAVIASEDQRFYRHGGVDALAFVGAVVRWPLGRPRRGASTVSMQLATLMHPELRRRGVSRTLAQKWRQMRLAWGIERAWSKAEILEAYLNLVSYRGELQGVSAASRGLFGKAPHGLNESEGAILAALIRGPNAAPATVARRARTLLQALGRLGPDEDLAAAVVNALKSTPQPTSGVALAPHVSQYILRGRRASAAVGTTLERTTQAMVTEALRRQLSVIRWQHVSDGAVLVVDNPTGDVLAYVAGSGDLSSARYVDGIRARRQTGSILKPFLYGLALDHKFLTAASLLEDAALEVPVAGGLYRPRNYDERFRGLVTVRTALAGSLNIPAVRTLTLIGGEAFVQQLRRLGLEGATESGEYYGPSLALGSVDASLWELVNAYRTLANGGTWSPLTLTAVSPDARSHRRLYSEATAFLLSQILSDRESRSVTFGLENSLSTRFWSAVKTGTSKDMRDNWCIGYTGRYTVGVWVGNLSGEPMRQVSGMSGAAPIWIEVVNWLHRRTPGPPITPPGGVTAREVSFPGDVEPPRSEWFLRGTEPHAAEHPLASTLLTIQAPIAGEVIALDPDIPPAHQRIFFRASGSGAAPRWQLNGRDLGSAAGPLMWEPVPGRHTLSILDHDQRPLDTISFEVRPPATTIDSPTLRSGEPRRE